jgi:nucleoside-diphosphate-sugar epimerase
MKVLFIGGTGVISSACAELAITRGIDLYLLNRGQSFRPPPNGAKILTADIRDPGQTAKILANHTFDVVVNWIAFNEEHINTDLALFQGKTKQYVFISSASAYQTPPQSLPVTESTPLENPYWQYSRDKMACEKRLILANQENDFPVTVVRPSHTYDQTKLPLQGGWTIVDRMRKGKKIIVHGDGTSIWVLTHHRDFARGFVGLLGHPDAIGEIFHITSDELLTWNQIFEMIANAAGTTPDIVHIPSEVIAGYDQEWGDGLLGDKMHSMIFDNSKIKKFVPEFSAEIAYKDGVKEIMAWYNNNPDYQTVNQEFNRLIEKIISDFQNQI